MWQVVGFDSDPDALATAVERGALDVAANTLEVAVAGAELAVIATPVATIAARAAEVLDQSPSCTVTDVGSTKASICSSLSGEGRFVGGHPLAGSEAQTAENARAEMFDGSTWFLTPLPVTDSERHRLVREFVSSLGATPAEIDPVAHDRLVALTSHLPHALANLLANQAAGHGGLATAGASLTDMTRVAGANPAIWVDVFLDNAERIGEVLAEHRRRVEELEELLRRRDGEALASWIEEAARSRRRLG
jgi:prephenate dehydrogenase